MKGAIKNATVTRESDGSKNLFKKSFKKSCYCSQGEKMERRASKGEMPQFFLVSMRLKKAQ